MLCGLCAQARLHVYMYSKMAHLGKRQTSKQRSVCMQHNTSCHHPVSLKKLVLLSFVVLRNSWRGRGNDGRSFFYGFSSFFVNQSFLYKKNFKRAFFE